MMTWKNRLARLVVALALLGLAPVGAAAGDRSFSSVVKHIKSNYRAKQQGFLGFVSLGRFLVKVIRPAGVKNFKFTMLKGLDYTRAASPESEEFQDAIRDRIEPLWKPLVQLSSPRQQQWAYIYVTQEKKDAKILAVAVEKQQAFVFQLKFSPEKLDAFISDPKLLGISLKGNDSQKSGTDPAGDGAPNRQLPHPPATNPPQN